MRLAAIDCGTNSIRLLVADYEPDSDTVTDLVRRNEIVRLGQDVDRTGALAPEAIERTRLVLVEYERQLADFHVERLRMVATSASRDATNASDFRAMVHATIGVEPEVVTGEQEAGLSFAGAVRGLPASLPGPYLVLDIGGGSTEFVLGDRRVQHSVSVNIGSVRMTERHLHDNPPTGAQIRAAEADIAAGVESALRVVPGRGAPTLVGLAGSVTTVAAIALGLPSYRPERIHHSRISFDHVVRVTGDLLAMTQEQRLAIPVMHPGRADVIAAGALVLRVAMLHVGAAEMIVSEHDILDGICLSLV